MSEGIEMNTEEIQEEQKYNLIGFSAVRKSLVNVPAPGGDFPQAEELAKSIMNAVLADYFSQNEGHYLNPETRKYIIAGATMAYLYWHTSTKVDNGEERSE